MLTNSDLEAIQAIIQHELAQIKKDIRRLRKDLNLAIRIFDRDIIQHDNRISRVESHLGLPPIRD